jgi:hypothetical protein
MNNKKNIVYLPNDQYISDFINTVVIYMYNNQNRNYIIIGSDYLYLEDELLEIINNLENRVELFIEKSSSLAKLLIDIDLKWTIINGYKIIFKKEYNKYYHISIYRPKITILYLTDKIDDVLENCKKSIYKYSKKYNYNFIHQNSKYFKTFINRIEYSCNKMEDNDYICILYDYSYIVNYELSLSDIIRISNLENYTLSFDYINDKLLKNNIIIRNTRRLIDIIKELRYFSNDDNKLIKYIRNCKKDEININTVYTFINKNGGYNKRVGYLDLVHNMNKYKNNDKKYEMINILQKHMGNSNRMNLCNNGLFFNIVGRTYTIGCNNDGCKGTILFLKDKIILDGKEGIYKKINNYSYEIRIEGYKYIIVFFNNYEQYIGTVLENNGDYINGNLVR